MEIIVGAFWCVNWLAWVVSFPYDKVYSYASVIQNLLLLPKCLDWNGLTVLNILDKTQDEKIKILSLFVVKMIVCQTKTNRKLEGMLFEKCTIPCEVSLVSQIFYLA